MYDRHMTDKKHWKDLRKKLAEQGCTFADTKNSHTKIYGPDGKLLTVMQKSGSDWRAHKNKQAELKRLGIQL